MANTLPPRSGRLCVRIGVPVSSCPCALLSFVDSVPVSWPRASTGFPVEVEVVSGSVVQARSFSASASRLVGPCSSGCSPSSLLEGVLGHVGCLYLRFPLRIKVGASNNVKPRNTLESLLLYHVKDLCLDYTSVYYSLRQALMQAASRAYILFVGGTIPRRRYFQPMTESQTLDQRSGRLLTAGGCTSVRRVTGLLAQLHNNMKME